MSFMQNVRRIVFLIAIAAAIPILSPARPGVLAFSIKDPVRVNVACATGETFADSGIRSIVQESMSCHGEDGVRLLGDRAVAIDLDHDDHPEYLVPLSCGAACDCSWAILAADPPRRLGVVRGCVLDVSVAHRGWAEITTYSHLPASAAILNTYTFTGGGYHQDAESEIRPQVAESFERCQDDETCCP